MKSDNKFNNKDEILIISGTLTAAANNAKNATFSKKCCLIFYCCLMVYLITYSSCKKLVEVNAPLTNISSANVYSTDASAIAAVTGIYASLSTNTTYSPQLPGLSGLAALSADELTIYSGFSQASAQMYYKNALTNNNIGNDFWPNIYSYIYKANAALEGLNNSTTLNDAVKNQLIGEAKFTRAFCYFYLVNLYGDVPLVLTTDYTQNAILPRAPETQVWQQIIQDLQDAKLMLKSTFPDGTLNGVTTERVRPTTWAAAALLARCYLYEKKWADANISASLVINNSSLFGLAILENTFLKNSNEAIWQLQPVGTGRNTLDAFYFIIPTTGPNDNNFAYLSNSLINAFEPKDQRRKKWVNSVIVSGITYNYPYKYKLNVPDLSISSPDKMNEYTMVLRLAEQYLIRAEAEANGAGGGLSAAIADLNVIRVRAGLLEYSGLQDQTSVLNAIYNERRVELFTEWGQRWLDLKRTGTVDAVMGSGGACADKGGVWDTNQQLYPLPLAELKANPRLTQNSGY